MCVDACGCATAQSSDPSCWTVEREGQGSGLPASPGWHALLHLGLHLDLHLGLHLRALRGVERGACVSGLGGGELALTKRREGMNLD